MTDGTGDAARAAADATVPLDLHADLYRPEAVDRAVEAFSAVAACTVERHGPYVRVRLAARDGGDPALLARQLANWALAASVADPRGGL